MIARRRSSPDSPRRSNSAARLFMVAVSSMPSTALILANRSRPRIMPLVVRSRLDGAPRFFMGESYHILDATAALEKSTLEKFQQTAALAIERVHVIALLPFL